MEWKFASFAEDLAGHDACLSQEGEECLLVKLACTFLLLEDEIQVCKAPLLHCQGLNEVTPSDLHRHHGHEIEARSAFGLLTEARLLLLLGLSHVVLEHELEDWAL